MQVKVPDYTASERQTLFHQARADEILYGGAAGGGKTAAVVAESITIALEHPGIPINLFRRTIPELNKTIKVEIQKQCAAYIKAGHMTWRSTSSSETEGRTYQFDNGSTITLNYCDTEADIYRYQGAEMPIIGIDELTQFPLDWVEYLLTRNRTSNPDWPVKFMAGTNPGGIGHGWVKEKYIDTVPPETINRIIDEDGEVTTRIFIPAKVGDHPIEKFRKDYRKKLNAISDLDLRRALRDGDWDVFAGQVFTEWTRSKHVIEPFQVPEHWIRWKSYDHGYNTYACVLWFTQDPQTDRKYVYRELYVSQMGVSEIARQIKMLESGERVAPNLADPSIWKGAGDQNTGKSVAEMFVAEGVSFTPANNDRLAGKAAVHDALGLMPDGLPHLQVFANIVNLIRTLPSLPYDQHRPEDVDTRAEDHPYDTLKYGLMSQRSVVTPKPYKPKAMLQRKYG